MGRKRSSAALRMASRAERCSSSWAFIAKSTSRFGASGKVGAVHSGHLKGLDRALN
jgi:hypothetical protein